MRWFQGVALAGVMFLPAIACGQAPGKKGASAEQQVAGIETQWLDAIRTNNVGFLEKLLAPEFREVSSTGEIRTRTQLLARAQKPRRVVDELRGGPVKVRLYGNVAVLTGDVTIRGHHGRGAGFSRHFRLVRVLVERNGMWQAVATQATAIKK